MENNSNCNKLLYINEGIEERNITLFHTCAIVLGIVLEHAYPDDIIFLLMKDVESTTKNNSFNIFKAFKEMFFFP